MATINELETRTRRLSVLISGRAEPIFGEPLERVLRLRSGQGYSVEQYHRGKFKRLLCADTKRHMLHQINGAIKVLEINADKWANHV